MVRSSWKYQLCLVSLVLYACACVLYATAPKRDISQFSSFTPVRVLDSSKEVANYFHTIKEISPVLSIDTTEVYFQTFPQVETRTLGAIFATYDQDDPRIDPYIRDFASLFQAGGYEWIFFDDNVSRQWISEHINTQFPSLEWEFESADISYASLWFAIAISTITFFVYKRVRYWFLPAYAMFICVSPVFTIETTLLLSLLMQFVLFSFSGLFVDQPQELHRKFKWRIGHYFLGIIFLGTVIFIIQLSNDLVRTHIGILYCATLATIIFALVLRREHVARRDHTLFVGHNFVKNGNRKILDKKLLLFSGLLFLLLGTRFFLLEADTATRSSNYLGETTTLTRDAFLQHVKYQHSLMFGYTFKESKNLSGLSMPTFTVNDEYGISVEFETVSFDDQWKGLLYASLTPYNGANLLPGISNMQEIGTRMQQISLFVPMWIYGLLWLVFIAMLQLHTMAYVWRINFRHVTFLSRNGFFRKIASK